MPKEIFAELYVCWKCGNVSVDRNACEDCGGEMEFTYFVPESRPTLLALDGGYCPRCECYAVENGICLECDVPDPAASKA